MKTSLSTVTLTGIDDHTNPADLHRIARLSRGLFEVEFGVLHSNKQSGKGRYPNPDTINKFMLERNGFTIPSHKEGHPFKLSAHLCGATCRDFFLDKGDHWKSLAGFDRIQLNRNFTRNPLGIGENWDNVLENAMQAFRPHCVGRVILQLNLHNAKHIEQLLFNPNNRIAKWMNLLYDASGGQGRQLSMDKRLKSVFDSIVLNTPAAETVPAYAGGISPKNVGKVVRDLDLLYRWQKDNSFSIDMESGLRDDQDRFSTDLAMQVVNTCAEVMQALYSAPI